MTESEFKTSYIAQFLATYMAQRYDRDCSEGHVGKPYAHQPVEDAAFCADHAWEQIKLHAENSKSVAFNCTFKL